jgi:hypothetical protein
MNFNVIIPVIHSDLCDKVIQSMEFNTILPSKVIIIDNTKDQSYRPKSLYFPIYTFHSQTGYVNESWNIGISKVDIICDYVSILNDDIFLNSWFFQRVHETFLSFKDCGVACPKTVENILDMGKGKRKKRITIMKKREGWAMTIRKDVLDGIAPIPDYRIQIFHGDDWLWFFTKTRGYYWYKDQGNIIWHKVGAAIKSENMKGRKKEERNEWRKVMKELGG